MVIGPCEKYPKPLLKNYWSDLLLVLITYNSPLKKFCVAV